MGRAKLKANRMPDWFIRQDPAAAAGRPMRPPFPQVRPALTAPAPTAAASAAGDAAGDAPHFMMGEHRAEFPTDRRYCRNHLWLTPTGDDHPAGPVHRVGFAAYAVRLLQDVYFLDWNVDDGAAVPAGANLGEIESAKALSSLHPPGAGTVVRINPEPLADPAVLNAAPYDEADGGGWLYEFATPDPFLDAAGYVEHLGGVWETTQRIIKGQANR